MRVLEGVFKLTVSMAGADTREEREADVGIKQAGYSLLLDDPVRHIDDYRALNLAEALLR